MVMSHEYWAGQAAVFVFAAKGWNVIATMRNSTAVHGNRPNFLVAKLDVQDRETIQSAVAEGIARFGKIGVVVNNAGYGLFGVFEGTSREKVHDQFDVDLDGIMDVIRETVPHFRAHRSGLYINAS